MEQSLASSRVVVHNAVYNLIGFGVSALYTFLLIPLVVQYVGIEYFGLWSLMLALTGYIGLADLGLSTSFVKYIAEYATLRRYQDVNGVVHHGLLFYFCISLVVFLFGFSIYPALFDLLRIPPAHYQLARSVFVLSLISFGVTSTVTVLGSVLTGIQRMDILNTIMAAMLVLKFIGIWLALHLGFGLVGLMVADVAITLVVIAPLVTVTRRYFPALSFRSFRYDGGMMKRLLRFGTQLQVSRLSEVVQSQFDKLLLTRYVGLQAVSFYDFGSRPLGRLRALPLTAISSMVPAVSALDAVDDAGRIQAALTRATRYIVVISVPLFAFLICFAHEFLKMWLGDGFTRSATTMQILSGAYFLNVVFGPLALVSQGKGEPQYQMKSTFVQLTLNIVLSFLLVRQFGYFGAVSGTTFAMTTGALLFLVWYGTRVWGSPPATAIRLFYKPVLSILPAAVGALAVNGILDSAFSVQTRLATGGVLAADGIVFISLYVLMLGITKTFTSDDAGFVANVLPGRLRGLFHHERESDKK